MDGFQHRNRGGVPGVQRFCRPWLLGMNTREAGDPENSGDSQGEQAAQTDDSVHGDLPEVCC
jgi:hypothetical protein